MTPRQTVCYCFKDFEARGREMGGGEYDMATDDEPEELYARRRVCRLPIDVNATHNKKMSINDRLASLVTSAIGSMYAVYFLLVGSLGWMMWQAWLSDGAFDPYPYAFLLFLGNIIQLLLMPLIMVGQNIQSRHSELRAQEEYDTTVAAYHDVEEIMEHLAVQDSELLRQSAMLAKILEKLEAAESRAIDSASAAEAEATAQIESVRIFAERP